jgi:hypothetical protein
LRYASEKRIKRIIGHELAKNTTKPKDINKYINSRYSDIFEASEIIIKIGEKKWN